MLAYTFLIIVFIASILLKNPKVIGYLGELGIRRRLNRLDSQIYRTLNDVLLPASNGKTSQIDHVVVSPYGLFVIETKNYQGWIFGQENSNIGPKLFINEKKNYIIPFCKIRDISRYLKRF